MTDPETAGPEVTGKKTPSLTDAVVQLSDNTVTLTQRLTVSDKQHRRTRVLTWATAGVFFVVAAVGYNSIEGNKDTLVQACQNANETRAANMALWNTVLGSIQTNNPDAGEWVGDLLEWITVLYQPHDCNDLDRVYKVPPPPNFGAGS